MNQKMLWKKIDTLEDLRALLPRPHPTELSMIPSETLNLEIPLSLLRIMGSTFFQHLREQYPNIQWRWHVGNDPALAMRAIQSQAHEVIFSGESEYVHKLSHLAQQQGVALVTIPSTQQVQT